MLLVRVGPQNLGGYSPLLKERDRNQTMWPNNVRLRTALLLHCLQQLWGRVIISWWRKALHEHHHYVLFSTYGVNQHHHTGDFIWYLMRTVSKRWRMWRKSTAQILCATSRTWEIEGQMLITPSTPTEYPLHIITFVCPIHDTHV
jgi:hypothetical protein